MKSSKRQLYNVYSSNLDILVAAIEKKKPEILRECRTQKERHYTATAVLFQGMYRESNDIRVFLSSINAVQALHEFNWVHNEGRNIIFPDSADVLTRLFTARYSVKNSAFLADDNREFVLATPKGFCIDGYVMPSCLVSISRFTQVYPVWVELLGKSINVSVDSDGLNLDGTMDLRMTDGTHKTQTIRLEQPQKKSITITYASTSDNMTMQVTFELDDFILAVSAKNVDDYYAVATSKRRYSTEQPDNDNKMGSKSYGLTEREMEQQYRLFKLVAAMLIYTAAEPAALKEGFPSRYAKSKGEPVFEGQYNPKTFSLTGKQKASPKSHLRSFHYRQLMHEKYYQGKHKHMKPGSRVVFVRETFVGETVTAETLVDEEA